MLKRLRQIGISCALKKLKHSIFMDADTRNLCALNGAYEYLQRYRYACNQSHDNWTPEPKQKIIWTCWWQGVENAPQLVKKCIENMHKFANGYEVIVIDEQNLSNYVTLPAYILEKHRIGCMTHTHLSDIIRLALLSKYGGFWIDSTILLTETLPLYMEKADFFCFRSNTKGSVLLATPFLTACAHHPIIDDVLALHYEYWKQENHLVSYSVVHLFFTVAIESSSLNKQLWEQMPIVYSPIIDMLQPQLGKPFEEKAYKLATQLFSIHKLTYKFNQFGIDITRKGTLYDVLINGNELC